MFSHTSCGNIVFEDKRTEKKETSVQANEAEAVGSDTETQKNDDSDITIEEKPESAA